MVSQQQQTRAKKSRNKKKGEKLRFRGNDLQKRKDSALS